MILLAFIASTAIVLGCGLYYACAVIESQVLGPSLVRGPLGAREIAITFDDGPAPPFTERILDILREHNVTATFFVCGKNAERHPETLRRIHAEKHTIGNHTYSHPFLCLKGRGRIVEEIGRTQNVIEQITGCQPRIFRPPFGIRWFGLFPVLRQRGLMNIQWSDTGFDWMEKNTAADIARLALSKLRSGSVILLHDGRDTCPPDRYDRSRTVAALPAIIEGARKAGFSFVSIENFI
jgi:peptidoglycan/xylan/chitin deacetylase (PgdA/CDA1 family)